MANPSWVAFLVLLLGCTSILATDIVQQEDYGDDYFVQQQQEEERSQVKGDVGSPSEEIGSTRLGFDGILQRHDGYVKGETPTIPKTSFSCSAQQFNPGLYADIETQCQVYHVCFENRQESFLCGPGTNFNQKILGCDFWYNFNCQDSPSFYSVNSGIGKVPEVYRPTGEPSVPGHIGISQRPISPGYNRDEQRPISPGYPRDEQRPISPGYPRDEQRLLPHDEDYRPSPPVPALPPRVPAPPPRISVHTPPPRVSVQPHPPRVSVQPPPPRVSVQPPPPRVSVQPPHPRPPAIPIPQPPRIPEPAQPPIVIQRPPPRVPQPAPSPPSKARQPPPIQQQVDIDYNFESDYRPPRPALPPPPPPPRQVFSPPPPVHKPFTGVPSRPVFPPVVSPPRVSRPPIQPSVIVERPVLPPRPNIPVRPHFPPTPDHPDYNIKGSTDYRPIQQPPSIPQPSIPIDTSYPSYPPSRPSLPSIQQEHVEVDFIPSRPHIPPPRPQTPPPRPRTPPPRPQTPPPRPQTPPPRPQTPPPRPHIPPPRPIQQEFVEIDYVPPPPPPPPRTKQPVRPQPPVSPSIIHERQKPQVVPPSRPHTTGSTRPQQPPPRPRPVFPPTSDHPNANIKGGPGYQQPPPQQPKFEPTRISTGQRVVHPQPPPESSGNKPISVKQPQQTGSTGYQPPLTPDRIKQPSVPIQTDYRPPSVPSVSVVIPPSRHQPPAFPQSRPQGTDHPDAVFKGSSVPIAPIVRQPVRVQSPSTPISGVKRPQSSVSYETTGLQPPPPPSTGIKRPVKIAEETYRPPLPQPPVTHVTRVKSPSQPSINKVLDTRPQFPAPRPDPIDHPNANIKGGPGYQSPRPQQPVHVAPVVRVPPPAPSTTSQRKTVPPRQDHSTGRGYQPPPPPPPQRKTVYPERESYERPIQQEIYETERRPTIPAPPRETFSGVKQSTSYQPQGRPQTSSHQKTIRVKQPQQDYNTGSSYKRGSETYPKPEFQQAPARPYQPPISTPSRSTQTTNQVSKTRVTQDVKPQYPAFPGASVQQQVTRPRQPTGSIPPVEYPYREVPGHQPPHQPQVFPHRENPDHPNESLKGSSAYRPPPPAGFQPSASDVVVQKTLSDGSVVESSKLGDVGSE